MSTEPIPYGHCHCGCGGKTSVSKYAHRAQGVEAGEPRKYIAGHHKFKRSRSPIWSEIDQCYLIPLTRGKYAKVDAVDAERVGQFYWSARIKSGTWYAQRGGSWGHYSLHRFIASPPDGMLVDHIDGDGLNNTRRNLRICTYAENARNRDGANEGSKSGFIGANWSTRSGKWVSRVMADGRSTHLGYFLCPIEAAIARDVAALELHGEFASLNFPELREVFAAGKGAGA